MSNSFWQKVDKTDTCWLWTGYIKESGYGQIPYAGKERRAHRYAYKLLVGDIPETLVLDHLCGNRACVNPDHLEPVTQRENLRRSKNTQYTININKQLCERGHPLSGVNLFLFTRRSGTIGRNCKECKRLLDRRAYWRAKEKVSV